MKVLKITAKNIKVLARSKTSLIMVVFGPLLIMLLVGFAFNNSSVSKINIGYYTPGDTNLTESFVNALQSNADFVVIQYNSQEECVNMIEQGKVHLCIVFPQDFEIANNETKTITFYVDQSRVNFVYSVIDSVSSKVSLTSNQLSYQMTNDLLSVIDNTREANAQELQSIIQLKGGVTDIASKLTAINTQLGSLDLSTENNVSGSTSNTSNNIQSDIASIQNQGSTLVTSSTQLVSNIEAGGCTGGCAGNASILQGQINTYNSNLNTSINTTTADLNTLLTQVNSLLSNVNDLNGKLSTAHTSVLGASSDISQDVQALSSISTQLESVKSLIETTNSQISSIKITSAESIVNPIKTSIQPVNTKSSNLNFIFPYFLILIIVFIGIMLSSNIIINEKTSRAYFRNYTTPTSDFTFIMSVFLTGFFVVILQVTFILALAYYFLNASILGNLWLTILLILAAIALFTLIGMIIGYLFNSQDAVTMASISVGSVFLFLSNLILPLESMATYIQDAAKFNPYVIASELLKKLTVFNASWNDVYMDFALIGIYIVVAFILVVLVQKASKVHFISKKPITKQLARKEGSFDKYFKLKGGVLLMGEKDFESELEKMSDADFALYVTSKRNDFASWLTINNKPDLAKKIGKCTSRKEMLSVLKKHKDEMVNFSKRDPLQEQD